MLSEAVMTVLSRLTTTVKYDPALCAKALIAVYQYRSRRQWITAAKRTSISLFRYGFRPGRACGMTGNVANYHKVLTRGADYWYTPLDAYAVWRKENIVDLLTILNHR